LDYGIHTGFEEVKALAGKVTAIQNETPVKVNEDPPKTD